MISKLIRNSNAFLNNSIKYCFSNDMPKIKKDFSNEKSLGYLIKAIKEDNLKSKKPLPDKLDTDNGKLTVFIDIDDVFLHTFYPDPREAFFEKPRRTHDYLIDYEEHDVTLYVYLRPKFNEFMEYLKNNTEAILYCTGTKSYVDLIAVE